MEKYIKINDLLELIDKHKNEINKDYKEGKMSMMLHIAMTGALEHLKEDINK